MKRVVYDFFNYMHKSEQCFKYIKQIDWSNFNINLGSMGLKSFLEPYIILYSKSGNFERDKLQSKEDYVWGSRCYIEEILEYLLFEYEGSEDFWISCQWGFDIKTYFSKKLYFAPTKGISEIIGHYAQLGFWETCNVSGKIIKFKKVDQSTSQELELDKLTKSILTVEDCINLTLQEFKRNGVLIERISYQKGEEDEINHKMIESIIDFMRKKRDLIDISLMLSNNKVEDVLDRWGTERVPPTIDLFEINIDGVTRPTNDVMVEYESLLDNVHKNALVETPRGKLKLCDTCLINDTPNYISSSKLSNNRVYYNGLEIDIKHIIKRLDFIADKLMEQGVIFSDGAVTPIKNKIFFKEELPKITQNSNIGTSNVRLSQVKRPFKWGIRTGPIPFNIKSDRSALNYNF